MNGPIYQPSGIIPTVIGPQESHGLCAIPNQHEKITVSEVISLMESLTLPCDQNFYPEASPGDAGKANNLS